MSDQIKISIPTRMSNINQEIEADKIWICWGSEKEIRLSSVLEFVLKQIEVAGPEQLP